MPTKTIAEVRWLYEHGFPPTFLAQIYGLTYNHTMQIGQSTIARKVPPWPPSWINESEWLRLGVPERAFLKKE